MEYCKFQEVQTSMTLHWPPYVDNQAQATPVVVNPSINLSVNSVDQVQPENAKHLSKAAHEPHIGKHLWARLLRSYPAWSEHLHDQGGLF